MLHPIDDLVKVTKLTVHDDDRGSLYEVLREDDAGYITFGQNYVVTSRVGAVRGFHYHDMLTDHFTIVNGSAIFCVWSVPGCRDEDDAYDTADYISRAMELYSDGWPRHLDDFDSIFDLGVPWFKRIVATGDRPVRIDVPPGVAHGWCALEPNTILLSTGSEMYNRDEPDEYRLPWDLFGDAIWKIQNK